MASYTIRDLDSATVTAARDRARAAGGTLSDVLRAYLVAYAEGTTAPELGGRARWRGTTAAERSDRMRETVQARWRDR